MAFVITTLYTVFLGTLASGLVKVEYAGSTLSVHNLIRGHNGLRSLLVMGLFFVDWVCFLIVFPPAAQFSFTAPDAALLLIYVPSLASLSIAAMLSLEDSAAFCLPLGVYHFMAWVGEIVWVALRVGGLESVTGHQVQTLVLILGAYSVLRLVLGVAFVLKKSGSKLLTGVDPLMLIISSLALKPGLLLSIARLSHLTEVLT